MDIRKIRKIIDLMKEKEVGEIEITEGEEAVRISQFGSHQAAQHIPHPAAYQNNAATPHVAAHTASEPVQPADENEKETENAHTINSPMVGTFYGSPSPDAEPFVKIGQRVTAGDVLCIIEAMKMFNQIECDKNGTIIKILAEDGYPIEYDQPLFILKED